MIKRSKPATRQARQSLKTLTQRSEIVLMGRAAAGIWAALRVWGFQGRAVLIPANTCYIVLWAILKSGNHPLLVDVDPRTANLTAAELDQQRAAHPAVVIPCHMYGLPAPLAAICQWANANSVKVIEDAALALGASVDGQPAGSWGDASILSFGLGKIVDQQAGGALTTNDAVFAREVRRLLAEAPVWDDHRIALTNQWHSLYWILHRFETQNPRLTELYPQLFALFGDLTVYQLANTDWGALPALLRDLPHNLARRAHLAALYDAVFNTDANRALLPPLRRPSGAVLWRYPLLARASLRDDLLQHLWEHDLHEATCWYPTLRPMTTALAPYLTQPPTPNADLLGASIINLPLDHSVTENDVLRTVEAVRTFWQG
jgi:dTDP-4-amino-4,6-dideoxygalactose transaminase